MLAYIFERFPKWSQTFCYREVAELFRQGVRPQVFSLRPPELGPEAEWAPQIFAAVHQLPEGDAFAVLADEARRSLSGGARTVLREWRGRRDSLRLHQAAYIGVRLRAAGVTRVHAHFAGMAARTAYWINRFFGIPFSLTAHANDIFAPNNFEIGLPEICGAAQAIVAVSDFAASHLRHKFPDAAGRVHRIYNGIDPEDFTPSRFEQPPLIVSVGRLIRKKGFDALIDACSQLTSHDFHCEIVGDGPLRTELQRRIDERGLTGRITLGGAKPQHEVAALLARATMFVLPCRIEEDGAMDNLPTVVMEAMAASLPVVSTDVGGIPEMIDDARTGFVVPQNDVASTARAMGTLLDDQQLAVALGVRGRERCAELFSLENNVRALRQLVLRQ
jgi:colanic acid/amylovoran biosynthesis glycosyltransferase